MGLNDVEVPIKGLISQSTVEPLLPPPPLPEHLKVENGRGRGGFMISCSISTEKMPPCHALFTHVHMITAGNIALK